MPRRKSKQRKARPVILVLLICFFICICLLAAPMRLGIVVPGWEIYNQVGAVRHADTIYSTASQFTSPKELMGVYWKVDIDDPYYQVPTIYVGCGDITHVDFMGRVIPNDQPASSVTKTIGNSTYYLDYHIYLYTITIRTIADAKQYNHGGTLPGFIHETSWPHEFQESAISAPGGNRYGTRFAGGAYVKFVISPWRGDTYRTPPNSSYVLDNCWAGVMNTYVFQRTLGQVENQWYERQVPDVQAPLFVGAGIDEGNQVPMFEDDGTFGTPAPTIIWDPSISPDPRIKSTVVQYLPIEMFPGAYLSFNWVGGVQDLSPCDVAVMYTLRVDVLQQHKYTLETAYKPPEPTWPSDYFSWAESFWTWLFGFSPFAIFGDYAAFVAFLCLLGIVAIVIVVLLAIFAPGVLARLTGGLGRAQKSWKTGKSWQPRRPPPPEPDW